MTEKMKDSGIEWIGEIPEEWDCKKLKYVIANPLMYGANETGNDFDEQYPRYIRITDINENNSLKEEGKLSLLPEVAKPYLLEDGDMLFARSGATVGKTFLYRKEYGKAAFAGYLIKAHFNRGMVLPKYVYYSTLGSGYDNWKNTVFTQATIQNIGADKYSVYQIPIPSILEQQAIFDFLDKKVGQVDDILADLNKQVEILNQYKKSLITETVTKGLNPNAEMKDSGIDWIGEIPKEWEIKPLKYLTSLIIDGTHNTPTYVDEGIPFLRVTDITSTNGIDRPIDLNTVARISQEEHNFLIKRCNPQKGDILVSKNGTIGVPKVIDWEWNFSIFVSLCLIKVKNELLNKFLFYYFKSELVNTEIAFGGKTNTITNLHLEKIANFRIPVPPIQEQEAIVDYLDKKCTQIDDLITDKQKQIEKMENYKKSLIYEYVTGKKRVGV